MYDGSTTTIRTPHGQTGAIDVTVGVRQKVLAENGLLLNVKKTKFLSSEESTESIVDGRGDVIENVQDFRYLGSNLAADDTVDQAVKSRINAAWMKWRESTGILCDLGAPGPLKERCMDRGKTHDALRCCPVSKAHEGQLHFAEMRMLRWACGWTRLDRVRNEDVRTAMQTGPFLLKMREQRL
uniref:Reverse transcriptase domain-containing protein n=1 Tax=Haemonchus contortus TaxID=6289 RepID=A0A7I4YJN9_HAECO